VFLIPINQSEDEKINYKMKEAKSKWDINLDKVVCPECRAKQPALRIPKNFEQFMFGGWSCEKCSCSIDKHGNKKAE
jgi:hypothetical protein